MSRTQKLAQKEPLSEKKIVVRFTVKAYEKIRELAFDKHLPLGVWVRTEFEQVLKKRNLLTGRPKSRTKVSGTHAASTDRTTTRVGRGVSKVTKKQKGTKRKTS